MGCRGAAAAALAHFAVLLAVWSGAALAWCVWALCGAGEAALARVRRALPPDAHPALLLPLAAAPLALALAHIAVAGLRPAPSKPILRTFAVLALLAACAYVGVGGYGLAVLVPWLRTDDARAPVRLHADLRAGLRPLIMLVQQNLLDDYASESASLAVTCGWAAAALLPLLLLLGAALACGATRGRTKEPRSSLRRSSSMFYEPSAPPPQFQPRALSTHAPSW